MLGLLIGVMLPGVMLLLVRDGVGVVCNGVGVVLLLLVWNGVGVVDLSLGLSPSIIVY